MNSQPAVVEGEFANSSSPSVALRAIREVWADLPVWFVFTGSVWLNHVAVAMIDRSQYSKAGSSAGAYALTGLAPAAWVVLYFAIRRRIGAARRPSRLAATLMPAALLVPFLLDWALAALVPAWRVAPSSAALIAGFETIQCLWFLALAAHAYLTRGAASAAAFFGVGLVYGVVLENTGITLGFFSERGYHLYVPGLPAPAATMLGWAMIAYSGVWIAERFGAFAPRLLATPLRLGLAASALAISVDVQLDPIASLAGLYWRWHILLPAWFLSVPFCNYAAWAGAYLPFAWAWFHFKARADLDDSQRNWRLLALIPLLSTAGGLVWLGLMTVYERGVSGPTYLILGEFFRGLLAR